MPSKIADRETRYRAALDARVKPGVKLDVATTKKVLQDAKRGGLTESEVHVLRGWAEQHRDAFDAGAQKLFEQFVDQEAPRLIRTGGEAGLARPLASTSQPALDADSRQSRYEKVPGTLVVDGIRPDDPAQGAIGDCYLVSALSSLAQQKPEVIEKAIRKNADGTFTVTFWEQKQAGSPAKKVEVTVDGNLPQHAGQPRFIASNSRGELWPRLIEKAYASWKGSWDAITGGYPGDAVSALTGKPPQILSLSPRSDVAKVTGELKRMLAAGETVTTYTGATETQAMRDNHLVADHAYSVMAVVDFQGQPCVQLRNPWGVKGSRPDTHQDVFMLPVSEFVKSYDAVDHL